MQTGLEIIRERLFWLSATPENSPKNSASTYVFCIDDILQYQPFCEDFGPLNLSCIHRFCKLTHGTLTNKEHARKKVILTCSTDFRKRSNAAFLMGAYQIVVLGRSANMSWYPFSSLPTPFVPYRDALSGPCTYPCTILDCLRGLEFATKLGWYDYESFDINSYDFYSQYENGDMNWIVPGKFLAMTCPLYTTTHPNSSILLPESALLSTTATTAFPIIKPASHMVIPSPLRVSLSSHLAAPPKPEDLVSVLRKFGIRRIIRLCEKTYDRRIFQNALIDHEDLFFPDGTCPSKAVVQEFLQIAENHPGLIAVHCRAGLGRTVTLIGVYCIKKFRFPASAFIGWARIVRPGSVLGVQQQFLLSVEHELLFHGGVQVASMSPISVNSSPRDNGTAYAIKKTSNSTGASVSSLITPNSSLDIAKGPHAITSVSNNVSSTPTPNITNAQGQNHYPHQSSQTVETTFPPSIIATQFTNYLNPRSIVPALALSGAGGVVETHQSLSRPITCPESSSSRHHHTTQIPSILSSNNFQTSHKNCSPSAPQQNKQFSLSSPPSARRQNHLRKPPTDLPSPSKFNTSSHTLPNMANSADPTHATTYNSSFPLNPPTSSSLNSAFLESPRLPFWPLSGVRPRTVSSAEAAEREIKVRRGDHAERRYLSGHSAENSKAKTSKNNQEKGLQGKHNIPLNELAYSWNYLLQNQDAQQRHDLFIKNNIADGHLFTNSPSKTSYSPTDIIHRTPFQSKMTIGEATYIKNKKLNLSGAVSFDFLGISGPSSSSPISPLFPRGAMDLTGANRQRDGDNASASPSISKTGGISNENGSRGLALVSHNSIGVDDATKLTFATTGKWPSFAD